MQVCKDPLIIQRRFFYAWYQISLQFFYWLCSFFLSGIICWRSSPFTANFAMWTCRWIVIIRIWVAVRPTSNSRIQKTPRKLWNTWTAVKSMGKKFRLRPYWSVDYRLVVRRRGVAAVVEDVDKDGDVVRPLDIQDGKFLMHYGSFCFLRTCELFWGAPRLNGSCSTEASHDISPGFSSRSRSPRRRRSRSWWEEESWLKRRIQDGIMENVKLCSFCWDYSTFWI